MKSILFNLINGILLMMALPWIAYGALRYGKRKSGWMQKLFGAIQPRSDRLENRHCVWFHAVSVGEVNLLAPLLSRLRNDLPGWHFFISTTTDTGYELACKKYPQCQVFFCPLDFSWAIGTVLTRLNPALVVLAELELWPNLITSVKGRGIPLAVVNGRLSENSFAGYRRIGFLMRTLLSSLDLVAAQTEVYADRFRQLGAQPNRVHVTGSVKFDGVNMNRENEQTKSLSRLAGLHADQIVFVAGSTQPEEDVMAIDVWSQLVSTHKNLRLVLVPRHPHNVARAEEHLWRRGVWYDLRSQLTDGTAMAPVLIVDTVGELGGWWGRADVAYVGGSMGSRGGQNMIEPAAYGVPVSFGPNTKNFRDVTQMLLANGAAQVIHDAGALQEFVSQSISDSIHSATMGRRAQMLVEEQQGAADLTARLLRNLVTSHLDLRQSKMAA